MSAVTNLRKGTDLELRHPEPEDGARIWSLVQRVGTLELNSAYAYLLFTTHFPETCVVAEKGGELKGFVVGYRPPRNQESVFVWQIGVAPEARRQGLGKKMLAFLVQRTGDAGTRFLEATVAEDNRASIGLFRALAEMSETQCRESVFFPQEIFPESHETEMLLRIGPFEVDLPRLESQEAS